MIKKVQHIIPLIVILLVIWYPARAIEMRIPVKPDTFICDHANIFNSAEIFLLQNDALTLWKEHHIRGYLVTVPPGYVAHIDTFINMLCTSWRICGDDSDVLLVMAHSPNHELYMVTGNKIRPLLNDTIAGYMTDVYIPREEEMKRTYDTQERSEDGGKAWYSLLTQIVKGNWTSPDYAEYHYTSSGHRFLPETKGAITSIIVIVLGLYLILLIFIGVKTKRKDISVSVPVYLFCMAFIFPALFLYALITRKPFRDPFAAIPPKPVYTEEITPAAPLSSVPKRKSISNKTSSHDEALAVAKRDAEKAKQDQDKKKYEKRDNDPDDGGGDDDDDDSSDDSGSDD